MLYDEAVDIASPILHALAPVCMAAEFAGSIRRGCYEVNDVEIVVVPNPPPSALFDDIPPSPAEAAATLGNILSDLIQRGLMVRHPQHELDGSKFKKFHLNGGIDLDLFIATPANFGAIYAIRTGSADFTRMMVTAWGNGGLMPYYHKQMDGHIQRMQDDGSYTIIPTPSEERYFSVIGLRPEQIPLPANRDKGIIETLRNVIRGNRGMT